VSHRDLARLLVKIAGLVVIVSALSDLPTNLSRLITADASASVLAMSLMTFGPASISICAGLIMIWGAGNITDHLLYLPSTRPDNGPLAFAEIEEIAVSLLGLYLVANGLAEALYYWGKTELYYDYVVAHAYSGQKIAPAEFGGLIAGGVRVAIGLALFFGNRGLISLRRKLVKQS
jgi:hypothetical protein